jgi:hypothetical protein
MKYFVHRTKGSEEEEGRRREVLVGALAWIGVIESKVRPFLNAMAV